MRFANGVVVTVNFGDKPYQMEDATKVEAMGQRVEAMQEEE